MAQQTDTELKVYNDANINENGNQEIIGVLHNTMNENIIDSKVNIVDHVQLFEDFGGDATASDNTTELNYAFGIGTKAIMFSKGTYVLLGSVTIPADVTLYFSKGGMLDVTGILTGNYTNFNTPDQQIFSVTSVLAGTWNNGFNVKWFGAKGDNSSNDTLAIQKAIDEVSELTDHGRIEIYSSIVYLPTGQYMVDSLDIKQGVRIKGEGQYLTSLVQNSDVVSFIKTTTSVNRYLTISDLSLVGDGTSTTTGLYIKQPDYESVLENVSIAYFYDNLHIADGWTYNIVTCHFAEARRHNIYIEGFIVGNISGCRIDEAGATNLYITDGTGAEQSRTININDNAIQGAQEYGIYLDNVYSANINGNFFERNCKSSGYAVIYFDGYVQGILTLKANEFVNFDSEIANGTICVEFKEGALLNSEANRYYGGYQTIGIKADDSDIRRFVSSTDRFITTTKYVLPSGCSYDTRNSYVSTPLNSFLLDELGNIITGRTSIPTDFQIYHRLDLDKKYGINIGDIEAFRIDINGVIDVLRQHYNNYTTVERDLLTNIREGDTIYNETTGELQTYNSSTWSTAVWIKTGSNVTIANYTNEKVGIGIAAPQCPIDVLRDDDNPQLRLTYDGSNYAELFTDSAGILRIMPVSGVTRLDKTGVNSVLYIYDRNYASVYSTFNAGRIRLRDIGGNIDVDIRTDGVSYFNGGFIGIGTVTPDKSLQVVGETKFGDDNTNYVSTSATGDTSFTGSAGFYPRTLEQDGEPAAGTGLTQIDSGEQIIWVDTNDSNKVYIMYNYGGTVVKQLLS